MEEEKSMERAQDKCATTANGSGQTAPQGRVALSASLGKRAHYADGIHALSVRGGDVRIDLFQTPVASGKEEQPVATQRVVLPVDAVNELMWMPQAVKKRANSTAAKEVE